MPWKIFTAILNNRIVTHIENSCILGEDQAGFRAGYSVSDHTFVLKSIIDLYLYKHKKLYCAFIDYRAAYDKINRSLLWKKLIVSDINGPVLKVIQNLYLSAKSCLSVNGHLSDYFPCSVGVRQGENLSPIMYALYVNDLKCHLARKYEGLPLLSKLARMCKIVNYGIYSNIFLLMYADDTRIMAESPSKLQAALNAHYQYCQTWELEVNTTKTKAVVFSRGKCHSNKNIFSFGSKKLETVDEYVYLGVKFNFNRKFDKSNQYICEKGTKAMFNMLRKATKLNLSIDLKSELFDCLVLPTLLFG